MTFVVKAKSSTPFIDRPSAKDSREVIGEATLHDLIIDRN
jgi:hypothetical protein